MAAIDFPTFHASWENDTRTISRGAAPSDRFYTNGVRVALTWAPADDQSPFHGWAHALLSRMPFNASEASPNAMANGYGYAIGQNMYTPSRIDRPDPDPRDRPARHILQHDLQHGMALQLECLAFIQNRGTAP